MDGFSPYLNRVVLWGYVTDGQCLLIKLSMICGDRRREPLTREVYKGNMHDGKTLEPTLKIFKEEHPKIAEQLNVWLTEFIKQQVIRK